jgi:hypothetical protein
MKQLFLVLLLTTSVINPSSGRAQSKRQPTGREEFDAAGNLTVEMRL